MAESGNESPTSPPAAEWLTYRAAGERLGMKATAVAARARRGRWPRRLRNDTGEAEVEVPGLLLAAGPQEPQERDQDDTTGHEPIDVAAIVEATAGPLRVMLDQATAERRELQGKLDQMQERHAGSVAANASLRGDIAVEKVKRDAAEAAAKDLRGQLDQAQARVDRLEAHARKAAEDADKAKAVAEAEAKTKAAALPAKRPWWRWG